MLLMSRVEPTDKTNASELQRPCPKKKRFNMNNGDYVCVHSSFLGKFHLPCHIIGDFGGCYQLYCSKGILNTAYSRQELTPLHSHSIISLEKWCQTDSVLAFFSQ